MKLNTRKIAKALTKKRSFGFKRRKPVSSAAKPVAKMSSSAAKQNAARAKFEKMGKAGVKPPSAKAQSQFNNLGTRTGGINARKRVRRRR